MARLMVGPAHRERSRGERFQASARDAVLVASLVFSLLAVLWVAVSPYRYVSLGSTTARVNRLTGETEVLSSIALDDWHWVRVTPEGLPR